MTTKIILKIRKIGTDLYSRGGSDPDFTKRGKAWTNIGFLRNHINQLRDVSVYHGAEVVEFELSEVRSYLISSVLEDSLKAKEDKKQRRDIRLEKEKRQKRHEEYLRLKKEFE